ncbi:hypothetical protein ACFS07_27125 [Undibacterium arcticum]
MGQHHQSTEITGIRMPTLNWIGKEVVVKHHNQVPFHLLEPLPELSCGAADLQRETLDFIAYLEQRYRIAPTTPSRLKTEAFIARFAGCVGDDFSG